MIVNNSPPAPHPTRARILAAATELFAELGYDGAGVDKIARRAGVNKAMLYYHVGDKQELFGAVVRQFITAIQSAVRDSLVDTTEPLDRLRAIPTALATVAAERPHWPQIMLRELAGGGTHLPDEALHSMAQIAAITSECVRQGRESGQLRDVDPTLTHLLLIGSVVFMANAQRLAPRMLQQGLFTEVTSPSPRAWASFVTDVLLHGILTTPQSGA
jgi:TetR/AcrR family transcriptional regulator